MNDVLSSTYGQAEAVTPEDLAHVEVGPGTLNLLPPGVDVKSMDASRTMSTFEPFTNMMISQIGAAIGTPAEVLLSRFQSSYSAARGALLQAASNFKTRRTWFARDFVSLFMKLGWQRRLLSVELVLLAMVVIQS